jgi:hypothetical protein
MLPRAVASADEKLWSKTVEVYVPELNYTVTVAFSGDTFEGSDSFSVSGLPDEDDADESLEEMIEWVEDAYRRASHWRPSLQRVTTFDASSRPMTCRPMARARGVGGRRRTRRVASKSPGRSSGGSDDPHPPDVARRGGSVRLVRGRR